MTKKTYRQGTPCLNKALNMKTNEDVLKEKRQLFHRLLIALGEEKYKEVIVEGTFPGIESTKDLNEQQLDRLISDAEARMGRKDKSRPVRKAITHEPEQAEIRKLRNRCLQVLAERGISSTPKDWSQVNKELQADRYQWILTDEQRAAGIVNKRGLGTFNTVDSLRKLFSQLCAIRDNENKVKPIIAARAAQN